MSSALELRGVSVRYGEVTAVDRATFRVDAGSFAALVGPSGCGKTSLLRAIAGFEEPAEGEIVIGGATAWSTGVSLAAEKRRVGLMFQEGALFPHLTVAQNVGFGLHDVARQQMKERVAGMLQLVGLQSLGDRFPHELSGGQQQRTALARALAPAPALLLLDEPFGGLDAALRVRLREEVRDVLRRTGTTAVLVTHDQEEALSLADQVSVMQSGRILQTGIPAEIYDRPASVEVAKMIGDGVLLHGQIRGGRVLFPLGALGADAPDGPCTIRLRSEDVQLSHDAGAGGVVVSTRFYGHDVVVDVRLDSGELLQARQFRAGAAAGEPVRVLLRGPNVRIFPAEGPAVDAVVRT